MADFPIGTLTEEQCRILWQDYQSRRQLIAPLQNNLPQRPTIDEPSPHRVFVANGSGMEIPPFACMQVTGATVVGGRTFVTVRRPDTICGEYIFNSQFKIEAGGYGWGYAWGVVKMLGTASTYESCKRYTAIEDSWAVAEGPGPFLVYGAGSISGTVIGRIVGDHCQARWIKFNYVPGEDTANVEPTAFYDGQDPAACSEDGTVEVEYPCGQPLCETDVMAFFDPNTNKYQAVTTPSAMLGEPTNFDLVRTIENDPCGVKVGTTQFKMFPNSCNPSLTQTPVELGEEVGVVLTLSSDACGTLNYAYSNIRAFLCDYPVEFDSFPINFDGVEFVTAAAFGPPTCDGEATYTWNVDHWDLTTPCSSGCESEAPTLIPSTTDEFIQTVPCSSKADSQCGLNLQMGTICQDTSSGAPLPMIVHVRLPLEPVKVVTEVYDNATDAIVIEQKTIYVCNWETYPDDQIAIGTCDTTSSGG